MAARKPITTTGIVLRQDGRTGCFSLQRSAVQGYKGSAGTTAPEYREFPAESRLDAIAIAAGLVNGYWLRGAPADEFTVWTWVQL